MAEEPFECMAENRDHDAIKKSVYMGVMVYSEIGQRLRVWTKVESVRGSLAERRDVITDQRLRIPWWTPICHARTESTMAAVNGTKQHVTNAGCLYASGTSSVVEACCRGTGKSRGRD